MIKIFIGVVFLAATGILVKRYALPLVPEFSIDGIVGMPMADLLKVVEAIVFTVILTGFVLQECLHLYHRMSHAPDHGQGESAARWWDLTYLLVAIAGSAVLYLAYFKASGGV